MSFGGFMDIEEIKRNIKNKNNKLEKSKLLSFLIRIFILSIIFLIIIILLKTNVTFKNWFNSNVLEKNISFSSIKSVYSKYFGSILPFDDIVKTETVFNEKLNYSQLNIYEDGIVLTVDNNYLIPIQYSGVVVFVGEKEKYGNTVIVESEDVTIWYGNVNINNIKLYDNLEKGKYLGETLDNKLYMVFKKEGKIVDYKNYI